METQTFAERIADETKVALAVTFVRFIQDTAKLNALTEDTVWQMWQKYSDECRWADQSALTSEFLQWNKLRGEEA
jgi:hypothetical protein